jgi:uncharacterized NAD(P)/FAD-binding protein YdhS
MSAFAGDANHFLRFAVARDPSVTSAAFVRRSLYGDYIADCLASAEATSPHRLVHVTEEVVRISPSADGHRVTVTSGDSLEADFVVLATGSPRAAPAWSHRDVEFGVRSPWTDGAFADLPRGARVVVVGTGLTTVDVALTLARDPDAEITAVSRHGLLPQTHGCSATPAKGHVASSITKSRTARELVRAVREAVAAEERAGGDWRSVVDSLRSVTGDLWGALGPAEQRRFLRHVRPFWETHRHRIPRSSAEAIASLRETGRLCIEAGRVRSARRGGDGSIDVAIELSRRRGRIDVRADVIYDCAGPAANIASSTSRVIRSLLESGHAASDPSGLGLQADPSGEIISAEGCRSAIFAVGPLVRGLTYEATAVTELRLQAERTAAVIAGRVRADVASASGTANAA